MDFLSKKEKILEEEFTNQGFIIREAADKNALNKVIKSDFISYKSST